jgi:uncharacterized lipoprotein YbaY
MPAKDTTLSGKIVFEANSSAFDGAAIYIRVEDVSRADAASVRVAEQVLQPVSHPAGSTSGPDFHLPVHLPDPSAHYIVRVHVDVDGDGRVSRGDFISTQSYPVLTRGHPDHVEVTVKQI